MPGIHLALIQLQVGADKSANLKNAQAAIQKACSNGANLIALPEVFNSPFGNEYFDHYAENIPGESTEMLSEAAQQHGVYIIGGSIPERDGGKLYNTCTVFDDKGQLVAKHRKVHLFDVDIPGRMTFRESDSLNPGNSLTTFEMPNCKVGLGICYDVRFAEMAQLYAHQGCHLLVYPGAFSMTTGPAHWELLTRARALDNQIYVAMVAPARDEKATYVTYGHSLAADPWGKVLVSTQEKEDILYADINLDYLEEIRNQIPIRKQRRTDLYGLCIRLALIQLAVGANKSANLKSAQAAIQKACSNGVNLVALPEVFNSPYGNEYFSNYAENIHGESTKMLSEAARQHGVYIIGGSIPERDGGKLFNTCTVFDDKGQLVAKHRKVHLFDIDVPGKITFKESDTLSPGSSLTTFDMPNCKVGLGICYDVRFAEMAQLYAHQGCHLLVYPGAFNMTTGPVHWELLARARALDNQIYVALVSPARDEKATYVAYGHSLAVDPWGKILASTQEKEDILYADINVDYLEEVRSQIPIRKQRRTDLYGLWTSGADGRI
ncbi:unnamed protein product [Darwinula stevensoni]|uniref:omega-amidase n=1 Tax=Darwinula stevensoni TaxID=69355 RepID=A0A7R8XGE9_9CRUS|nr:unnamed protein product [Darwinula stevensoni]CAG0895937.1 unnamed protein product [Darwinula stevensoni]